MTNSVSAERSLAGAVLVSLLIAGVASRFPKLAFGSFVTMFLILVGGNVVVYLLTKVGVFRSSKSG